MSADGLLRLLCILLGLHATVAVAATSAKPKRIIWKGVETFETAYTYHGRNSGVLGRANEFFDKTVINFTYVEETDSNGNSHFISRKIAWNSSGRSVSYGFEGTTCQGSGSADVTKPDQKFDIPCKKERYGIYWGFFPHPRSSITPPKLIGWEQLRDDCSYSEEETNDHGYHRYSVTVAADVDANMEVSTGRDSEYWQFVPVVGEKLSFSVHANVPARFRFTLENVSHFPGFATNAAVDFNFFTVYRLDHLRGKYDNNSADLIFDPNDFENNKKFWMHPQADMQVMETAQDSTGADVTVTAMDFGAYGHLRAEVKSKCGGWQPVRIRVGGRDVAFVTIPMDENNNLIADRMEQPKNGITEWAYTGDPGSDEDNDPKGDGTPGDGFTLFEEYRGFMAKETPGGWDEAHVRTNPKKKDLFLSSSDQTLERLTAMFGGSSGLDVHTITADRYISDGVFGPPIVNFTLQKGGPKQWNGKTISQATPQHGITLMNVELEGGVDGVTQPRLGPPKYVAQVDVDKEKCLGVGEKLGPLQLARVVIHELGHAISIPHHGDTNIQDMVLLNQTACQRGTRKGSVAGKTACRFEFVAVQHGQNSGDQDCPMKYIWWDWYVPPSSHLAATGGTDGSPGPDALPTYTGDVPKPYLDKVVTMETDYPGLGEYCTRKKGTGINQLAGDANRAGDATVGMCANLLHVNDVH